MEVAHLNGRPGLCAAVWRHRSKVRVCGLGLLRPWLNGGPVCAEGGMRKCGAM